MRWRQERHASTWKCEGDGKLLVAQGAGAGMGIRTIRTIGSYQHGKGEKQIEFLPCWIKN